MLLSILAMDRLFMQVHHQRESSFPICTTEHQCVQNVLSNQYTKENGVFTEKFVNTSFSFLFPVDGMFHYENNLKMDNCEKCTINMPKHVEVARWMIGIGGKLSPSYPQV